MVRRERARSPVAPYARSVRDLGLGGHAAADAGRPRRAALQGVARAVADRRDARRRDAGRRHPGVERSRIQPPCGQPAPVRPGGRRARRVSAAAGGAPEAARHRAVHRRGDRLLRIRRPDRRSRHQRPPCARARLPRYRRAAAAGPGLRLEPGPLRPRPRDLHRPHAALRRLPARRGLPVTGADLRTASPPDPFRGLVPAAAGAAPASHRRCWAAARGRVRRRGARLARPRRPGRGLRRRGPAARSDEPCDQLGQPVERAAARRRARSPPAAPGRPG